MFDSLTVNFPDTINLVVTVRHVHEDCKKRPGPLYVLITETQMADTLHARVLLPPVVDGDVTSRELTVTIDGGEAVVNVVQKDATEFLFDAPQDSNVSLSLVDVDDSGNRSEPSVRDVVMADTFPPAAPGELGVEIIGETEETSPTP